MQNEVLLSKSGEYIYSLNGEYYLGISNEIIKEVGEIINIKLPQPGERYEKGEILGYIESEKAANEIYMPITGIIESINEEIMNTPDLLNKQGCNAIRLIKIRSNTFKEDRIDLEIVQKNN